MNYSGKYDHEGQCLAVAWQDFSWFFVRGRRVFYQLQARLSSMFSTEG
jgi:hypothetical protein